MESIFIDNSSSEASEVHDVPVSAIIRPIASELDECKVEAFMQDMQRGDRFTPIEVLWVQRDGKNYYFAFGGCHRWAATQRLGLETIRARLIKTLASSISLYLGASSPFKD
jgi:sulfiredoxin